MHLDLTMRPSLLPLHPSLFPLFLVRTPSLPRPLLGSLPRRLMIPRFTAPHTQLIVAPIAKRRQRNEPKRRSHIILIQIMHIINIPKRMRRIRNKITPIRILGILQKPIALIDMILDLILYLRQLGYLKLADGNGRGMIILEKSHLSRIQKEERPSHPVRIARNARHPQNVLGGIVRGFELDHPVHRGGDVEVSSGGVGGAEYALVQIAASEEGVDEILTFLSGVHGETGDVEVVEESCVEFGGVGGAEEDHYFLVHVLFEEGVEEEETQVFGTLFDEGVIVGFEESGVEGYDGGVVLGWFWV